MTSYPLKSKGMLLTEEKLMKQGVVHRMELILIDSIDMNECEHCLDYHYIIAT